MSERKIVADFVVEFPTGKRIMQMQMKYPHEIDTCPKEKVVVLILRNGDQYTGFCEECNDDDILLKSLDEKLTIGLKHSWLHYYWQEM